MSPPARGAGARAGGMMPEHLYFHVPFCASKCAYCDFFSVVPQGPGSQAAHTYELLYEQWAGWLSRLEPRAARTVYIGGGTPTSLGAARLSAFVATARGQMCGTHEVEITVEANPESFDELTAEMLADAGATRVSLGVQAFHDDLLAVLGRPHDATRALAAARAATEAGLDLSVDLICGIPGQTLDMWRSTVEYALETGARHVSVYPLSLESGTPLAAEVLLGRYRAVDEDVVADMMVLARDLLEASGLLRYEVANYAVPGHECRHNRAYWTGREYLGIGPSAHGMLDAATARTAGFVVPEDAARVRYAVAADIARGFGEWPAMTVEVLTEAEALREDVMLGLRLSEGVPEPLVEEAGVGAAIERLEQAGLLVRSGGRVRTTERGWLLGNEVFGAVWTG
ncbi:radical SAM family heme chaperone HemW [Coriobacteriia bacterium Es71-Z0120]|uniref:radical SAM family heme chaperone HemW n=1 Tax=Parvivirga hydrogeniphila TaxID=2939460 RepID=UPI002260CFE2|nr:radical SAM family heme chaperone HemW [Parvivirga hydrogeniphila]MCL4078987.1 radical SAM family heme chaperone HemW [Parvivirga hydrogeniphila]